MTKKNYQAAVEIVHNLPRHTPTLRLNALAIENAFVEFFKNDSHRFDENRFREACKI